MDSLINILEGVASELIALVIIAMFSGLFWSVRGRVLGPSIPPQEALMWVLCFTCLMVVIVFTIFDIEIPSAISAILPFVVGVLAVKVWSR